MAGKAYLNTVCFLVYDVFLLRRFADRNVVNGTGSYPGAAAGDGAGEGEQVVVEVVSSYRALAREDKPGGFAGGKVFEQVANGFVVVDFLHARQGVRQIVGFIGRVSKYMDFECQLALAHGSGTLPVDGVVDEQGRGGELKAVGLVRLTVVEVDILGGAKSLPGECFDDFRLAEKGLNGLIKWFH